MVRSYGYPAEDHSVVTEDGYILGVHRIPHGANNEKVVKHKVHIFPNTYSSFLFEIVFFPPRHPRADRPLPVLLLCRLLLRPARAVHGLHDGGRGLRRMDVEREGKHLVPPPRHPGRPAAEQHRVLVLRFRGSRVLEKERHFEKHKICFEP